MANPALFKDAAEQVACFTQGAAPTYDLLEKHIGLLTAAVFGLMQNMMSGDAIYLGFAAAEDELTRAGYPPELVQRCLQQLRSCGDKRRHRSAMFPGWGTEIGG